MLTLDGVCLGFPFFHPLGAIGNLAVAAAVFVIFRSGRSRRPDPFAQLALASDVARCVPASRVRYHCASRATPLKRGSCVRC
jgi:hypothetical protein